MRVITIGESAEPNSASYAAEVRARHEVRLSFRVGGKIVERLVEVGSKVRAGQALARLDAADFALAAASAKAQAASVETERNLAAAELYRLTGDDQWHQLFLRTTVFTQGGKSLTEWKKYDQAEAA